MDTPPDHLALDEARHRLWRLRPANAARMGELSRLYASRAGRGTEGGDLLNEAIARVLDGKRRWPADLPVDVFFSQVMRSIAAEWRQRDAREPSLGERGIPENAGAPDGPVEVASIAAAMRHALAGDPEAFRLFELQLAETTASEIRQALGLDATAYDTLKRRFRRRLLTVFPEGYPR